MALLKDTSGISRDSHWSEVKKRIDSESRYKAVESSSRREDWFRDYVKHLKDRKHERRSHKSRDKEEEVRATNYI